MTTATVSVALDLDHNGVYEEDVSAYVLWDRAFTAQGLGRENGLDRAGLQSLTLHLNNQDGRFSPRKAAGAYYPDLLDMPIPIEVTIDFDSETYGFFTGYVWDIHVDPDGETWLTCRSKGEALSRIEIDLPAMRDVYTGIMVHRILDLAEGELCANPRFAHNLDGYEETGGDPLERVADSLEGAWAMSKSAVNNAGWVRHLDDETDADVPYRITAYVWGGDGDDIRMFAADDVHGLWPTSDTAIREGRWNRLTYDVTFDAASINRDVYLVRTGGGTATLITGAVHIIEAHKAIPRAVDGGISVLQNNAYRRGTAGEALEEVRQNELNALFYFDGDGAAVFEDGHHRWEQARSNTSQATFTTGDNLYALEYMDSVANRVSKVIIDYPQWEEDATVRQVWGLFPVPVAIPPGETLVIPIDYQGGLVRGTVPPVANTDWFVNAASDGSGADLTGDITFVFDDYGGGAQASFENTGSVTANLTSFVVRGRAVRKGTSRPAAEAVPSVPPPENIPLVFAVSLNQDANRITGYAGYLAERYGAQVEDLALTLFAPCPNVEDAGHVTLLAQMLELRLSDRITVVNTARAYSTFINGAYWVERIDREISGGMMTLKAAVSPVDAQEYFVLDVSELDTGVLAPF